MSNQGLQFKLSKKEQKRHVASLQELFPHVPVGRLRDNVADATSFDEALEATLAIADRYKQPEPKPELGDAVVDTLCELFPTIDRDSVARVADLAGNDEALATDMLLEMSAVEGRLEQSVEDLQSVFSLSREDALLHLSRNSMSFDDACMDILRQSLDGKALVASSDADSVAFLRTMFPQEDDSVLQGMLDSMASSLEDVVDFYLSLDLLQQGEEDEDLARMAEAATEEEQLLAELMPSSDADSRLAALEASQWDVNEAYLLLQGVMTEESVGKKGNRKQQRSKRWLKLSLGSGATVGPSSRWNGANEAVKEALDAWPSPTTVTTSSNVLPERLHISTTSKSVAPGSQYSEHVFTHGQYAGPAITAADLGEGRNAPRKMAMLHAENRRRYVRLATQAHLRGDGTTARSFRQLGEREERLRALWSSRSAGSGERKVDLHGFFVREAMEVVRTVLHASQSGERIVFITGRGKHSQGGVARIRNALLEMLAEMPGVLFREDIGQVMVELK